MKDTGFCRLIRGAVRAVLLASTLATAVGACKPKPVPPAEPVERPEPVATPTIPAHQAPEADFVIPDDVPIDPAEVQRSLRENCCDEMPADEVKAHLGPAHSGDTPH